MSRVRQRTKGLGSKKSDSKKKQGKPSFRVETTPAESPSCISKCFYALLFILMLIGVVALIGYHKAPFTALPITDYAREVKLEGKLEVNKKLSKGTKLYGLLGPESIEEDANGNLYSGLMDGRIVRIAPSNSGVVGAGEISTITEGDLSKKIPAPGVKVGRPLGLRLVQNELYVADAYYGIFSVNLNSNDVTSLMAPNSVSPKIGFADDLCVSKDRRFLYFTDASSKYSLATMMPFFLEGICDGRVLRLDLETKEIRTVMSDLCFPNGIQLSADEKLLFVSESFKFRVRIIDMTTWKTKQFVDLPTVPDNIRPTGKGTYWVTGGSPWAKSTEILQKYAFLRQIVAGLFPNEAVFNSFSFYGMVVEMNDEGEILQSLQDPENELTGGLAQASYLKDGRLVLGTYISDFLAFSESGITAVGNT